MNGQTSKYSNGIGLSSAGTPLSPLNPASQSQFSSSKSKTGSTTSSNLQITPQLILRNRSVSNSSQLELRKPQQQSIFRSNNEQPSNHNNSNNISNCVGTIDILNTSSNRILYKIRGNQPQNYRLSHSTGIVEVNASNNITIRLLDLQAYSSKNLFQVSSTPLTKELSSSLEAHNLLISHPTLASDWSFVLSNQDQFPVHTAIVAVRIAGSSTPTSPLLSPGLRTPQRPSLTQKNTTQAGSATTQNSASQQQQQQHRQSDNRSRSESSMHSQASAASANSRPINQQYYFSRIPSQAPLITSTSSPYKSRIESFNPEGGESEFKILYENLVVQVEEHDKMMFVLNLERKKLESEWLARSQQQETRKAEQTALEKSHSSSITFTSAITIAFVSLLIGIYLGN